MNPKARITYRFDANRQGAVRREPKAGQEQPLKETAKEPQDSKIVPLYPEELRFTSDAPPWNSPFQDDSNALEQLIRDTDRGQRGEPAEYAGRAAAEAGGARRREAAAAERSARERAGAELRGGLPAEGDGAPDDGFAFPHGASAEQLVPLGERERPASAAGWTAGPPARQARPLGPERADEPAHAPGGERLSPLARDEERAYAGYVVRRANVGGPSWLKVIASVLGALATGALFGYAALALFAGQAPLPSGDAAPSAADAGAGAADEAAAGGAAAPGASGASQPENGAAPASAAASVEWPARSYQMLQYGVFSNEDGLRTAVADLQARGYASGADRTDGYRAFAGIAADREAADALGEQLDVPELFVKAIELPAVPALAYAGGADAAQTFFARNEELVRALIGQTGAGLGAGAADGDWREAHRLWIEAAAAFEQGLQADDRPYLERMREAAAAAVRSLEAYENEASRSHLWQAQTNIMDMVLAEKEWRSRF